MRKSDRERERERARKCVCVGRKERVKFQIFIHGEVLGALRLWERRPSPVTSIVSFDSL